MPRFVLGEYHQQQARTRAWELRLFTLVVLATIGAAGMISGYGNSAHFQAFVADIQSWLFN